MKTKTLLCLLLIVGQNCFADAVLNQQNSARAADNFNSIESSALTSSSHRYQPYLQLNHTRFFHVGDPNLGFGGDAFLPLWQNYEKLVFTDLRFNERSGSVFEGNAHVGYRQLLEDKQQLYGLYGAFDRRRSSMGNYFSQLTFGGEYWINRVFLGANYYQPIGNSDKLQSTTTAADYRQNGTYKNLWLTQNQLYEKALTGVDGEVGYEFTKGLIGYAGGYYFGAKDTDSITGPRARVTYDFARKKNKRILDLFDSVGVEAGVQKDNPRGVTGYVGVNLKIGLSREKSELEGVSRHMVDLVRRDVDIVANESNKHSEEPYKINGEVANIAVVRNLNDLDTAIHDPKVHVIQVDAASVVHSHPNKQVAMTGLKTATINDNRVRVYDVKNGNPAVNIAGISYLLPLFTDNRNSYPPLSEDMQVQINKLGEASKYENLEERKKIAPLEENRGPVFAVQEGNRDIHREVAVAEPAHEAQYPVEHEAVVAHIADGLANPPHTENVHVGEPVAQEVIVAAELPIVGAPHVEGVVINPAPAENVHVGEPVAQEVIVAAELPIVGALHVEGEVINPVPAVAAAADPIIQPQDEHDAHANIVAPVMVAAVVPHAQQPQEIKQPAPIVVAAPAEQFAHVDAATPIVQPLVQVAAAPTAAAVIAQPLSMNVLVTAKRTKAMDVYFEATDAENKNRQLKVVVGNKGDITEIRDATVATLEPGRADMRPPRFDATINADGHLIIPGKEAAVNVDIGQAVSEYLASHKIKPNAGEKLEASSTASPISGSILAASKPSAQMLSDYQSELKVAKIREVDGKRIVYVQGNGKLHKIKILGDDTYVITHSIKDVRDIGKKPNEQTPSFHAKFGDGRLYVVDNDAKKQVVQFTRDEIIAASGADDKSKVAEASAMHASQGLAKIDEQLSEIEKVVLPPQASSRVEGEDSSSKLGEANAQPDRSSSGGTNQAASDLASMHDDLIGQLQQLHSSTHE